MFTQILKTADAAAHVGLAVPTLEKMRVYGTGPRFLKLGRSVRYSASDLDAWLNERRVASTSQQLVLQHEHAAHV